MVLTNCGELEVSNNRKLVLKVQKSQKYSQDGKMSNFMKMIQFRKKSRIFSFSCSQLILFYLYGLTDNYKSNGGYYSYWGFLNSWNQNLKFEMHSQFICAAPNNKSKIEKRVELLLILFLVAD